MKNKLPTFIHAGAQRSGSTWLYHALKDHPDIFMPEKEPVNYFDCHYHKGISWYLKHFEGHEDEKAIGDESPGYIKNPFAPKRAAEVVPDAKIIFCLRNPVHRAYSQYWTAENIWSDTSFGKSLTRHSVNDVFITPGYYDYHLTRWEKYFDKNQMKITFFDDFVSDNESFIQDIYGFIGVDDQYKPTVLDKKIQSGQKKAGPNPKLNIYYQYVPIKKFHQYVPIKKIGKCIPEELKEKIKSSLAKHLHLKVVRHKNRLSIFSIYRKAYKRGDIAPEVRKELEKIYREDIKKLEKRTNRNLDHWFEFLE